MTPSEVVAFAKEKEVKIVDFKFTDLPGPVSYTHLTLPTKRIV